MQIFDNIISKKESEKIKNVLYDGTFPWYFVSDITHLDNKHQSRPGHFHLFMDNGKPTTLLHPITHIFKPSTSIP